jgi:hypothetical protein
VEIKMELVKEYLSWHSIEHKFKRVQRECTYIVHRIIKHGLPDEMVEITKQITELLLKFKVEDKFQVLLLHTPENFSLKVKYEEGIAPGVRYQFLDRDGMMLFEK